MYTALGVTLPRLDNRRKVLYNSSVQRYAATKGQLFTIDDVTGDKVRLLDDEGTRQLRMAALRVDSIPMAKMEPVGLEFVTLLPGERAVLPVRWEAKPGVTVECCSTHPEAPPGLAVLLGPCKAMRSVQSCGEDAGIVYFCAWMPRT